MHLFALVMLCSVAVGLADDCLTKLDKLQASVDLSLRERLESRVNGRINQHFDEVKGYCASGTPAASLPLGQVDGVPSGVSGPARCALYCQDYDGCISFNFLPKAAVDGTQCQLFTVAPKQCTAVSDNSCRHFQTAGHSASCKSTDDFKFFPGTKTYFKPIFESLTWEGAQKRCRQLNPFSHLAVFRNMAEYNELVAYLRTFPANQVWACSTNTGFGSDWAGWWTANRKLTNDAANYEACKAAPRVWAYDSAVTDVKPEAGWEQQMFLGGMPDCSQYWRKAYAYEMCMAIPVNHLYQMNDMMCDYQQCAVCQLDVD